MKKRIAVGSVAMSAAEKKRALLLGFGLFGAQFMWMVYNTYMPIFLQAGNPRFNGAHAVMGFGFSATMAGFIMTLDNLAALFIQPLMGPVSDRTRTRFGRRMPYILIFAPIAAAAFALIPVGQRLITPETSGRIEALGGPFALLMVSAVVMLVAMAVWRTPLFALLPDLFRSELRSQANGIVNLMAGIGSIIAFVAGGYLFSLFIPLPFWFASLVTLAAALILYKTIREPERAFPAAGEDGGGLKVLAELKKIPPDHARSLVLLILAVFFYLFGYNSVETFFSSWAVTSLGVSPSVAAYLMAVVGFSFIVFAVPGGMVAARIGRNRTISLGLVTFAASLLLVLVTRHMALIVALLILSGFSWAMININGLPMVLDTALNEDLAGTYSGLYFIGATLSGTLGPIVNGWVIDLAGQNYAAVFVVCPVAFMLSFLCLRGVKTGEVKAGRI